MLGGGHVRHGSISCRVCHEDSEFRLDMIQKVACSGHAGRTTKTLPEGSSDIAIPRSVPYNARSGSSEKWMLGIST